MALQTSGAISLNQIHVEAGGTSGTQASLNDTDIRGLTAASGRTINSTSGTEIDFADFYGASAGTTTAFTVTQGTYSGQFFTQYGYQSSVHGSISPTSFDGRTVTGIYRTNASAGDFFYVRINHSSTPPDDAFDRVYFYATGTDGLTYYILGYASQASISTANGGYTKLWMFNSSNGMTSSEMSHIANEWDGSGNITVTLQKD